ncbi:MAG: STAS domain-containing protein, partial [Spirochaetota bacterium]
MKCVLDVREKCAVIKMEGTMSDDFLREIRTSFEEALSRDLHLVIDISQVCFISSSGLGLLFNSNSRLKSKGKKLFVSGARD